MPKTPDSSAAGRSVDCTIPRGVGERALDQGSGLTFAVDTVATSAYATFEEDALDQMRYLVASTKVGRWREASLGGVRARVCHLGRGAYRLFFKVLEGSLKGLGLLTMAYEDRHHTAPLYLCYFNAAACARLGLNGYAGITQAAGRLLGVTPSERPMGISRIDPYTDTGLVVKALMRGRVAGTHTRGRKGKGGKGRLNARYDDSGNLVGATSHAPRARASWTIYPHDDEARVELRARRARLLALSRRKRIPIRLLTPLDLTPESFTAFWQDFVSGYLLLKDDEGNVTPEWRRVQEARLSPYVQGRWDRITRATGRRIDEEHFDLDTGRMDFVNAETGEVYTEGPISLDGPRPTLVRLRVRSRCWGGVSERRQRPGRPSPPLARRPRRKGWVTYARASARLYEGAVAPTQAAPEAPLRAVSNESAAVTAEPPRTPTSQRVLALAAAPLVKQRQPTSSRADTEARGAMSVPVRAGAPVVERSEIAPDPQAAPARTVSSPRPQAQKPRKLPPDLHRVLVLDGWFLGNQGWFYCDRKKKRKRMGLLAAEVYAEKLMERYNPITKKLSPVREPEPPKQPLVPVVGRGLVPYDTYQREVERARWAAEQEARRAAAEKSPGESTRPMGMRIRRSQMTPPGGRQLG